MTSTTSAVHKSAAALDAPVSSVKPRTTSLFLAIFNLTKSAVGLGTVLLVEKMQVLGLASGIAVIIGAAVISSISLHFLNRMSYNLDVGDFVRLSKLALGRGGEVLCGLSILLVLLGSLIAYAYFIGTYAQSGISFFSGERGTWYTSDRNLTIIIILFFVFPMACLKYLSKLGVTSIAGMGLMIAITGLVTFKSLTSDITDEITDPVQRSGIVAFSDLPLFQSLRLASLGCVGSLIFAYMNHFTMVSLTQVLINPTPRRRMTLNVGATALATAIYLTMSIFGYRYYRNLPVGDALSVPTMTGVFAAAKLAVAVVLVFSFPLLSHPTRDALDALLGMLAGNSPAFKDSLGLRYYAETAFVVLLPLLVAVSSGDSSLGVLAICSSLFGSILVFVLPPLMFLKLRRKYITSPLERGLAYALVILGAIIAIVGPIPPTYDLLKGKF